MKYIDLTGQQFGRWVVEKPSDKTSKAGRYWWCVCQCEKHTKKEVLGSSLRQGKSKSCGCLAREHAKSINFQDLTGQVIDWLTIIKSTEKRNKNGSVIWKCLCKCGNYCERSTITLNRKNEFHSCGCYNTLKLTEKLEDLTGNRYGILTVLKSANELNNSGQRLWVCKCDCGNIIKICTNSLKTGNTSSCGCINYSIGEKHIENILKKNNIIFKAQYTEKSLNKKRFDFAIIENNNIKRLIEFDGRQHYDDISGIWNSPESLLDIQTRDKEKNQWAKEHNIPLVRIPYWERDNITLEMIMGDQYLVKKE